VSAASGNDANDCNRLTPCRTFQRAHDQTFDQGEITVLDPGGYGAVTITKSIAIVNDGVGEAGMLVSGGFVGITINAPNAYVHLRGLTIQGIGGGNSGIVFNNGYSLAISNCVIRSIAITGMIFSPAGDARLAVSDTLVADNGSSGILISPSGTGAVRVDVERVDARNNGFGIAVSGGSSTGSISAAIADSVLSANGDGIHADSGIGNAPTVVVTRSVIANNRTGLLATHARLVVGDSAVSGNTFTWFLDVQGGILQSFGDNYIVGNGDGDPALPLIPRK